MCRMGRMLKKGGKMMVSEAQKRASQKYNRQNMKNISFSLHKETDKELIAIYEAIPDKAKWFREMLKKTGK